MRCPRCRAENDATAVPMYREVDMRYWLEDAEREGAPQAI